MALKLTYYGQNDSQWSPDVTLTGDPGTDQQTLTAAGYLGGKLVAIAAPITNTSQEAVLAIADADNNLPQGAYASPLIPFGALINGPGEFAGAIGPSGSKKVPVVRALWQGNVNNESYDAGATFVLGTYLYCGGSGSTHGGAGYYSTLARGGASALVTKVGICTHVPTTAEPWLGVASLL